MGVSRHGWRDLVEITSLVNAVFVAVCRSADGPAAATLSREALQKVFGPGSYGIVLPVAESGPADMVWLFLPCGFAAVCLVLVGTPRRCGIFVAWFRS